MNSSRVVIDTSVAVSAVLLPRSVPRQAFDLALSRGRLLISQATITELDEVIRRPKFDKYTPEKKRIEFLAALVQQAELIEISIRITECRDPEDDKFLELAVGGGATHLVSGDDDLLVLNPFRGIPIVTPQVFIQSSV
jgi:uncharacterized protein